jgi:type VI secretion system protein ImpK
VADAGARSEPQGRRGALALTLQEVLTVTARLRGGRQVASDAASFRAHVKQLLATADEEARRAGYDRNDIKLAIYAVTVFIDESVLNSPLAIFADWPQKPLQEEIFGGHMGGEAFFQNLRAILARQESEDLADLLEVHQLCLLLEFKGRYSAADPGELGAIIRGVADKIERIRGRPGPLAPSAAVSAQEAIPVARDPLIRPLAVAVLGAGLVVLLLWVVLSLALGSGASQLESLILGTGR